jgi:NAD(P)-dependent dehydrogenase (short-subunit alcohol dehydrogenase family)
VKTASDTLGPISLVANVAGGSGIGFGIGPLVSIPATEFRRVLEVNLVGTRLVSRACANRMIAAGIPGRICNTSSQASKVGFVQMGAYSAAKAAAPDGGADGRRPKPAPCLFSVGSSGAPMRSVVAVSGSRPA